MSLQALIGHLFRFSKQIMNTDLAWCACRAMVQSFAVRGRTTGVMTAGRLTVISGRIG